MSRPSTNRNISTAKSILCFEVWFDADKSPSFPGTLNVTARMVSPQIEDLQVLNRITGIVL